MKPALLSSRLPALALAIGYFAAAAPAAAQATAAPPAGTEPGSEQAAARRSTTYFDLTAGAGYSSNPFLQIPSRSTAFGRLTLSAYHGWKSERGNTWLTGYVENTTYLRGGYGSKQIFSVGAHTDQAVSEKVKVYGDLTASGDIAGQLSNRFTSPVPVGPAPPPVIIPPIGTTPELLNLTGRQYRLSGQVGASITTSARSSVTISAGAEHGFFTGKNNVADYTTYQGSFGYNHQLTESSSGGVIVSVQRQDFKGGDFANIINTSATYQTQLGQDISANATVGVLAIYEHRAGVSAHSYSPSFSGSLCKSGERTQLCARVSRNASAPLGFGIAQNARSAAITTNFDLRYSRKLSLDASIQASVQATRSSTVNVLQNATFSSTYITALAGYDRKVGKRLFAGVSVGARKLYQAGPDPKMDFNASLSLRYKLGDLL